jgi:hypothetical protein
MVSLNIQEIFHSLAITKGWGIQNYKVEIIPFSSFQILFNVRMEELVFAPISAGWRSAIDKAI